MNCQSFHNELFEYAEGSLAPARRRAADRHLAECAGCRQLLRGENQAAQALAREFRRQTGPLTLPPEFTDGLRLALRRAAAVPAAPQTERPASGWLRLLWPAAITACVLCASFRLGCFSPDRPASARRTPPPDIAVHLSYCVSQYTFCQQDGRVLDALERTPRTVDITFHPDLAAKPL